MQHSEQNKEEMDIALECSICLSDYENPKQLPCKHTFCHECLKTLCDHVNDAKVPCPLCKREFCIPPGGIEVFPDNELVTRLIVEKALQTRNKTLSICELCKPLGEEVEADSFCMECLQGLCRRCKMIHINSSCSKHHKIVSIEEKPTEDELQRLIPSYCDKHSNREVELYCCTCKILICVLCHAIDHSKHFCRAPHDIAKRMKILIKEYRESIEESISEFNEKSQRRVKENQSYMLKVSKTESDIRKSFDNIRQLLETSEAKMLDKLANIKRQSEREMESQNDFEVLHNTSLASFLTYCQTIVERGNDCEIIRVTNDLYKRAQELIADGNKDDAGALQENFLNFIASPTPSEEEVEKLVGTICVQSLDSHETFVRSMSVVKTIPRCASVKGVTVVGEKIFVVREDQARINVYDTRSLKQSRNINIIDLTIPAGIAGCAYNKALYISDSGMLKCIHRADLTNNYVTRWDMKKNHVPEGLSVTAEHTLLATVRFIKSDDGINSDLNYDNAYEPELGGVVEYTTEGQQLRKIRFDRSIEWAWHTVQLSSGQFVVCHGNESFLQRVCVIDVEGQIIKSCGGGMGWDQLRMPHSLAIDEKNKRIFVADSDNDRVLMFDFELVYLGRVHVPRNLDRPSYLYFDSSTDQLFVGEWSLGRLLVIIPPKVYRNRAFDMYRHT